MLSLVLDPCALVSRGAPRLPFSSWHEREVSIVLDLHVETLLGKSLASQLRKRAKRRWDGSSCGS